MYHPRSQSGGKKEARSRQSQENAHLGQEIVLALGSSQSQGRGMHDYLLAISQGNAIRIPNFGGDCASMHVVLPTFENNRRRQPYHHTARALFLKNEICT